MGGEVKNIAIVEDETEAMGLLVNYLSDLSKETGVKFSIFRFTNAVDFLTDYDAKYDVILMDIEMPYLDGMRAAHKLREIDTLTTLIFVTNVARLAVKGYEVGAFEYIVKPISYYDFSLKLKRALQYLSTRQEIKISIPTENGCRLILGSTLVFVEVMKHKIIYHTTQGDFTGYGTLKKVEQAIQDSHFVRCNSCYLVNLKFVTAVEENILVLSGGIRLNMSRMKRPVFMKALNVYLGMGAPNV